MNKLFKPLYLGIYETDEGRTRGYQKISLALIARVSNVNDLNSSLTQEKPTGTKDKQSHPIDQCRALYSKLFRRVFYTKNILCYFCSLIINLIHLHKLRTFIAQVFWPHRTSDCWSCECKTHNLQNKRNRAIFLFF